MLERILTRFDGTGRRPRPLQEEALGYIVKELSHTKVVACQLPTGVGKSAILRALQLAYGGAIIAPNNNLVKQYMDTYPDMNKLIGKSHYQCTGSTMGLTCVDRKDLGHKPCPDWF